MAITYRQGNDGRLSVEEMDNNFHYIEDQIIGLSASLSSGTSGVAGSSGTSGTSGTSGLDGVVGSDGSSGSSGTSGTSGTEPIAKYKVFTALLTQTDELVPEVTVLEDTIESNYQVFRSNVGSYRISFSGIEIFNTNKVVVLSGTYNRIFSTPCYISMLYLSDNDVYIYTSREVTGVIEEQDGLLYKTLIEVRVYN